MVRVPQCLCVSRCHDLSQVHSAGRLCKPVKQQGYVASFANLLNPFQGDDGQPQRRHGRSHGEDVQEGMVVAVNAGEGRQSTEKHCSMRFSGKTVADAAPNPPHSSSDGSSGMSAACCLLVPSCMPQADCGPSSNSLTRCSSRRHLSSSALSCSACANMRRSPLPLPLASDPFCVVQRGPNQNPARHSRLATSTCGPCLV